ncbi:HDOD domain-containing protein [Gimesia aquarii]|uniref:Transcriptional regulatory protein TcrA n=1 Tax=Gimesia aquarii TaxID=2527964 RepID=A0A517X025_9PLAN|nr:HDOD domain-containing protein [Gimesia aquarii]QDU10855.1 Transcriptional regulatory protein TcrA [Gimesia aquarii]
MFSQTGKIDFHALIADDDKIVTRMISYALTQEGFVCKTATDGFHASALMNHKEYDLVVTDLRMPHKNGHSLALDMLEIESRPVIMVHTAVEDPALTKDLVFRGIDDISYKPTNYEILASKARGLVERRHERIVAKNSNRNQGTSFSGQLESDEAKSTSDSLTNGIRITPANVFKQLSKLDTLLSLSHTPFDVYSMASRKNANTFELATLIEQDQSLVGEIINVANMVHNNLEGEEIDSVEKAISQMGSRSIGELAIMHGGRQALLKSNIPWINHDLLWKRSLAASKTVRIIERAQYAEFDSSAFLCALLHPIGRIVLATLFPDEHQELTEYCQKTGQSLDLAEKAAFGLSHGEVSARFFSAWRIPVTTQLPLEQITHTFDELASLPDHARQRTEIIKLALFLSRTAMGIWEPCDSVDVPHKGVLNRLNMPSIKRIFFLIREACEFEVTNRQVQSPEGANQQKQPMTPMIRYSSAAESSSDLLAPFLKSIGLHLHDQPQESSNLDLIDGVSLSGNQLRQFLNTQNSQNLFGIIRNSKDKSLFKPSSSICIPTTVQKLITFFNNQESPQSPNKSPIQAVSE